MPRFPGVLALQRDGRARVGRADLAGERHRAAVRRAVARCVRGADEELRAGGRSFDRDLGRHLDAHASALGAAGADVEGAVDFNPGRCEPERAVRFGGRGGGDAEPRCVGDLMVEGDALPGHRGKVRCRSLAGRAPGFGAAQRAGEGERRSGRDRRRRRFQADAALRLRTSLAPRAPFFATRESFFAARVGARFGGGPRRGGAGGARFGGGASAGRRFGARRWFRL